jgi:replicative superfamily II helicase
MKLELNNESTRKYSNSWRLNNTLLNDQWAIEEIREEIKTFLEFIENENTTHQNLWDTIKAVQSGKDIGTSAYIINTEQSQTNDLMLHLKLL